MKFLRVLVAIILVPLLMLSGLLFIIDHIATASYITSVAERTNAYSQVATALPAVIADQASKDDPGNRQEVVNVIQTAVTPDYLKEQFTSVLTQFQALLKGDGKTVYINLQKVADAAAAQSGGNGEAKDNFKNVTITTEKLQKQINVVHNAETAKTGLWILTALLLVGSLVLGYFAGSYVAPGVALIVAGVLNGLYVIGTMIAPDKIVSALHFEGSVVAFSAVISTTIHQVAKDLGVQFGTFAGVYLIVGILLVALSKKLPGRRDQVAQPVEPATIKS